MQVKNKQVTKHFTEKTIKEVWKEKLAERKAGRESDMCDFVCNFFQKRIGIMSAVVEVSRPVKVFLLVKSALSGNQQCHIHNVSDLIYCHCFKLLRESLMGVFA